jgi:hypothetical protein
MNTAAKRIALYYAPPSSSAWWREGCEWLGRDAENGRTFDTSSHAVTNAPRRYGWHATLVAPFHCAPGVSMDDVLAAARAWASSVPRFDLDVRAAQLGNFVALRAEHQHDDARLRSMASGALHALNALRTMPSAADIQRRVKEGMNARQLALLREWGYPYVHDEYRFHMTLSDSLDCDQQRASIVTDWTERIETLGPLPVHGAALFIEPEAGAPFTLWQRLPFNKAKDVA